MRSRQYDLNSLTMKNPVRNEAARLLLYYFNATKGLAFFVAELEVAMLLQLLLLAVGFFLLVKGADYFVEGAAAIADKFGIPQLVIGLTIVAMGTSAPEAAVSITAALKGNAEITIGNVVGSNIFNVLLILGITACIVSISVAASTVRVELPFMIGVTLLLLALGITGNAINLFEGIILLICFVGYLAYLFAMAMKDRKDTEEKKDDRPLWKLIFFSAAGLFLIVLGSDVTVDAAVKIAGFLGISERIIGLTIVAMGTSLPELVTSVSAARKGKADIAIGNIVGSNIFNVLFIVGITAVITPVTFVPAFIPDTIIAAVAGGLLFACVFRRKKLTRAGGILLLFGYAGYFFYLL